MSITESLRTSAASSTNMFKMETDFWTQGRGPPQNMAQNLSQSGSNQNNQNGANNAQNGGSNNGNGSNNHPATGASMHSPLSLSLQNAQSGQNNNQNTNPNTTGLIGAHSPATGSIHSPGNHSQASSQGGHPTHQILTSGTLALAASMQQNQNSDSVAANALAHHLHQQQQHIQANQNSPDSKMMTEKLVSELQLAQQAAVLSAAITQQQNQLQHNTLNTQQQNLNQQPNLQQTGNVTNQQSSRCNSTSSAHNINLLGSPHGGVGSPNTAATNPAAALQAAISGLSGINAAGLNAAAALSAALQQQQQLQQFAGFGANGGFGLSPTGQMNPAANTGVVGQGNQNPLAGGNSNSNQGSQGSQGGFSAMSAAINERTLEECWSTLQRILMHKNAMQMHHARELGVNSLAGNLASLAGRGPGGLGSDVKPHQCTTCLKSFSSNHQLVQHIRVHTGEKPYKCSYCDRRFKQLSHVQQHTRLHTGERPYKCHLPDCGRAFIQLSNLQQHLRNHDAQVERAKNRPFHCNICGKGFATESSLRTHTSKCVGRLQQHAALLGGPHAATCPLCHRLFLGGGEELMEHMKHTHKDPNASGVASFLNIPNAFSTNHALSAITPMDTSNPSDAPLNMSSNASNNANATNNANGASTANPTGINNLAGTGTGTGPNVAGLGTGNAPTPNFGATAQATPGAVNNPPGGNGMGTSTTGTGVTGSGGISTPTSGGGNTNNHLQLAAPNSAGSNPGNTDFITYNHLAKRRTANHPCPICGKHYVNEGSLRKHLACHPETSQLANAGLRMYPCSACQAVFTHEAGLLNHMESMRMEQKHQFAAQYVLSRAAAERRERELLASQAAMLGLPTSASLVAANAASLAAAANQQQQQSGQLTPSGNPPMSPSAHSDSSSGNGRLSSAGSENGASQQGNATGLLNNNNNNNCTPKLGDILRSNNGLHGSQYNMDTDQLHVNRMAMMAAMTGAAHQTAAGMSPTDVANLAAAMRMGAVSQEFGSNLLRFQSNNANTGSPNTPPLNTDTLSQQALMMRASMDSMRNLSDMRMDLNTHPQQDALRIHQAEALLRTQAEAALRLAVSQAAVAAATQQQQQAAAANQQQQQQQQQQQPNQTNQTQQNESQNSPLGSRHNGGSNAGPFSISQGNQQLSPDLSEALKLQEALRLHHQQP